MSDKLEQDIAHEVERVVSTSQQRLRGLFSRRPITGAPAPADAVLIKPEPAVMTSALQTAPVEPPVVTTALQAATADNQAAPSLPLPSSLQPKVSKTTMATATHKAKFFAQRLRAVHDTLDLTMEKGVTALEDIERQTAEATAQIASVVSQKQADLGALKDVLNQLTNGGPDDEPEAETPAVQPGPSTTGNAA